jgi:hypothetical protein
MKVYAVTVFENGDMETNVWNVFDCEEKANKYKEEIMNDVELNSDGYYVIATVSEHLVK